MTTDSDTITDSKTESNTVRVDVGDVQLEGDLAVPDGARGVVLFAHGSGSSRFSRRNRAVAEYLRDQGLGTLLFDLLTSEEDAAVAVSDGTGG